MAADRPIRLLTFGHGTATAEELAELIRHAEIQTIVDVRSVPKSRLHPWVWRQETERWIPDLTGSLYRWQPALGGFRPTARESSNVALRNLRFRGYADYMESDAFVTAFDELLASAGTTRLAIMCSETVWWRCHRRLISDAAVLLHDVDVRHVMHDGKQRPHILTGGVRILSPSTLRYDVLFEPDV